MTAHVNDVPVLDETDSIVEVISTRASPSDSMVNIY